MIVYSRGLKSDYQIVDGRLRDVFLDERLRECVSFLYVDDLHGKVIKRKPIGTAFFVLKSLEHEDEGEDVIGDHVANAHEYFTAYAITACHVLTDNSDRAPIYIRINKRDGGTFDYKTDPSQWTKDVENDVAIFEMSDEDISLTKEQAKLRALAFQSLVSDDYLSTIPITAGSEVFFLGLFTGHPGKRHAQPVIRFGNISLMRHDKIDTYLSLADELTGKVSEIDAYLVEARSWGGQSGSPVLFYHPPLKPESAPLWARFQLPLILGLTHGQYERNPLKVESPALVSAGIASVIPAVKIRELIMSLKDQRAKDLAKAKRIPSADAPVLKRASVKKDTEDETGLTEDGFLDALKRASSKLYEPESKKTRTSE